jgi:hypothetical protein
MENAFELKALLLSASNLAESEIWNQILQVNLHILAENTCKVPAAIHVENS